MRNKFGIGVGLAAVTLAIVGPPFVAWSVRPYEPPLRVGMDMVEVHQLIGEPSGNLEPDWYVDFYQEGPDWLGHCRTLTVFYEEVQSVRRQYKVKSWMYWARASVRPPWLDRALKAIGW